jgi:hypothetical protein
MSPFLSLLGSFRRGPAPRRDRRPAVEYLEHRTLLAGLQLLSSQVSINDSLGGTPQSATDAVEASLTLSDGNGADVGAGGRIGVADTNPGGPGSHFLSLTSGGNAGLAGASFSGTATARFQIIPSDPTVEVPGAEVVLTSAFSVEQAVKQLLITDYNSGAEYTGTQNATYSASYTLYGQSHDLVSGNNSVTDPAGSTALDGTSWNGNPSAPPILARIGDEIDVSVQFSVNASFGAPTIAVPPANSLNPPTKYGGDVGGSFVFILPPPTLVPEQLVVFKQPPLQVTKGGKFDVQITMEDNGGGVDTAFTGPVTIVLASNPAGGTLGGTLTVNAVGGVADFPELTLDHIGTGYSLQATTAGQLPVTTEPFAVADQLEVTTEPPSQVVVGHLFDVQITAEDANGNRDPNFTGTVMVALANPGSSTLGGTLSVPATGGVADFPDLTVDKAGTGYILQAGGVLADAVRTDGFDVTDQLAVTGSDGLVLVGAPFDVQVTAEDAHGNVDPNFTGVVTVALSNNVAGGTLGGTLTVSAKGGVADIPDLTLDRAATGYVLQATSGGLGPATTPPFTVVTARLVVTASPHDDVLVGVPFDIQVSVEDAQGNLDPSPLFGSVTISVADNPANATLGGTLTMNTLLGVADFSNLTLDKPGVYSLFATNPLLFPALVSVTVAADRLVVVTQPPASVEAAQPFDVIIWAEDLKGNRDTTFNDPIEIRLANPGPSTLGGTTTVTAVNGVADFPGLTVDHFGGYLLQATTIFDLPGPVLPATTRSFDVTDQLVVTRQPPNPVGAGEPFDVAIWAEDANGKVDSAFDDFVGIALVNKPSGLGGDTIVTALQGKITFSALTVDEPGTGYALVANSEYVIGPVMTSAFDVTGAAPPQPGTDLTPVVPVNLGKSKRQGSRFQQTLTLVNRSGMDLTGPLTLLLSGLSRKLKVRGGAGGTVVRPPRGSPYVVLMPPGGHFRPGQTLTVTLTFTVPAGQRPRFTAGVRAGG